MLIHNISNFLQDLMLALGLHHPSSPLQEFSPENGNVIMVQTLDDNW